MILVHFDTGGLRNQLEALGRMADRPQRIIAGATGSVLKLLQQHFKGRQQEPNRLGGKKTNFWQAVYRSTQIGEVTDRYGMVVIGEPRFAQKVYGGTIQAGKNISKATGKPTKYLAIPARAEAHGKTPSLMKDMELQFVPLKSGGAALVVKSTARRLKENIGLVMFWLRRQVHQEPDPKALPDKDEIEAAALAGAEAELRKAIGPGASPMA